MICLYHSADLDGFCSGAIVKYKFPECDLYGINYGDDVPWELIMKHKKVYIVDFCLQPFNPDMMQLMKIADVTWIDHHKSSIEEAVDYMYDCKGIQLEGTGACILTWEHLFPGEKIPLIVTLLGKYDVWDHSDKRGIPLQYGMRILNTNPNNQELWSMYFEDVSIDHIIEEGKLIIKYIDQENEIYCRSCAFEVELEGLKCIAINRLITNSKLFDSIWDDKKYDAMLTFGWRKNKWTVSLYSDKENIDVSKVAKKYGGGGHRGASGFQCEELPFRLNALEIWE